MKLPFIGSSKLNLKDKFSWVVTYHHFVIAGVTLVLFAVALYRIDHFSSIERNETLYEEKVLAIDKVEFDSAAVERILNLKDLNVQIDPDFEPGRTDPFAD